MKKIKGKGLAEDCRRRRGSRSKPKSQERTNNPELALDLPHFSVYALNVLVDLKKS